MLCCREKAMMAKIKFPKEVNVKIDPKKVNWTVMREWIAMRVTELLGGLEEEVLIGLIYNYLEEDTVRLRSHALICMAVLPPWAWIVHDCPCSQLDGKRLHVTLTPFLEKNTSLFIKELWSMLASANQTASHIPQQLLEAEAARHAVALKAQQEIQVSEGGSRACAAMQIMLPCSGRLIHAHAGACNLHEPACR